LSSIFIRNILVLETHITVGQVDTILQQGNRQRFKVIEIVLHLVGIGLAGTGVDEPVILDGGLGRLEALRGYGFGTQLLQE